MNLVTVSQIVLYSSLRGIQNIIYQSKKTFNTMRRNYISPEFKHVKTNGTFNMLEQKGIFGSKMMEIEDNIILDNRDIIFYQNILHEQLNLSQEILLPPVIYSISSDKMESHKLTLDETQSEYNKSKKTKWKIEINAMDVLINYIFSNIKNIRSFDGIENTKTSSNNIDKAIRDYIKLNLISRYDLESIDLYLTYNKLENSGFYRYDNTWLENINISPNIHKGVESDLNFDKTKVIIKFTQDKESIDYNFNYYFDIKYKKI